MIFTTTNTTDFEESFNELLQRGKMDIANVSAIVGNIINEIKQDKNKALKQHIAKFDNWTPDSDDALKISTESMKKAYDVLDSELKGALHLSYDRIKIYHEKQKPKSWFDDEPNGTILGQRVTPVDSAGLYIPGGKAAYPSSLLMNVIPAQVAGVENIVVCTPTPDNEPNELLLAACHLCGVDQVYKVGGASAIAAMAYGTENIPKVDVITGPGNIFVATAKKMVFGDVNIDMIAGPSEIGILADESANASHLAIDMLSQAEHDEMASSILITPSKKLADEVKVELENWLQKLPRQEIARKSIEERGAIIVSKDMDEAIKLMNEIAPEHLEVATNNPFELLPFIKHAGAIFMGHNTPEAIGDYVAGPNHTLPTGGTAKFYSPLGVENFMKKTSIISFSSRAINEIGEACALIANTEGLTAHEQSVRVRLK
ncbi:histidinol dehydrogenase [bacterium]|nr:histidinol dehydrogenase [bacterium]MBU1989366.1 histidinol dehydrogenase [bacterium]